MFGEGRPYCVAVLTLDGEVAPQVARRNGIEFTDLADLARNPQVRALVQQSVDAANERLSRPEQVKKFELLTGRVDRGERRLTPTLKAQAPGGARVPGGPGAAVLLNGRGGVGGWAGPGRAAGLRGRPVAGAGGEVLRLARAAVQHLVALVNLTAEQSDTLPGAAMVRRRTERLNAIEGADPGDVESPLSWMHP